LTGLPAGLEIEQTPTFGVQIPGKKGSTGITCGTRQTLPRLVSQLQANTIRSNEELAKTQISRWFAKT